MEFIEAGEIRALSNPGVVSRQLLNPDNSTSSAVTITEVHLEPDACQPRHIHQHSEQIWYALSCRGQLLLSDGIEKSFCTGDVVRFEPGDIHGLRNDGECDFIYISVTSPPIHFGYAYREEEYPDRETQRNKE